MKSFKLQIDNSLTSVSTIKRHSMEFKLSKIAAPAIMFSAMLLLGSCSGKSENKTEEISEEEFYATQPVVSGQYDADYYNISGENARKGPFDGKILIALEPENSGIYVYENGNRAKIDYRLMLGKPFEKGADGNFSSVDKNGGAVTVATDSTVYTLSFKSKGDDVKIFFNPKPVQTATSFEIWQRISNAVSKK